MRRSPRQLPLPPRYAPLDDEARGFEPTGVRGVLPLPSRVDKISSVRCSAWLGRGCSSHRRCQWQADDRRKWIRSRPHPRGAPRRAPAGADVGPRPSGLPLAGRDRARTGPSSRRTPAPAPPPPPLAPPARGTSARRRRREPPGGGWSSVRSAARGGEADAFELAEAGGVVLLAPADDLVRLRAAVDLRDLDAATGRALAGGLLVREEVVAQAVEEGRGALVDVAPGAVDGVALEDGDDLVVGLVAVEHAQAADGHGAQEDVAAGDGLLGEDADVQRVAVADDPGAAGALGAARRERAAQWVRGTKP